MKKAMSFNFDNGFQMKAEGFSPVMRENGDFWRLHLDYCVEGMNHDLGVYSHDQSAPQVSAENGVMTLVYPQVVAEDKSVHDIRLTLTVEEKDGVLKFAAEMENNSQVRLNELQYPVFEFNKIDGAFEDDTMFLPRGLGQKIENPHAYTVKVHTEYMAADYKNIIRTYEYPGDMSMPWFGVQSGKNYFYMGAHSDICRQINLVTAAEPRESKEKYLIMTIASYPAVRPGETVKYDGFTAAVFDGDWRDGADMYRQWAEQTWLPQMNKKESIKNLHGWQRIILKHQYGEIFHTYDELPRIYKEGAKYGITMLLLFAWWKEGMDNWYPDCYHPDEALGGAEKLKQAIKEINDMGGTVVLYANGHLIDVATDYYKTEGHKYAMMDIEHNEYREFYKFSNNGTLLKYGHKTFAGGCYGTSQWRDKVQEIADNKLKYGSNGIFFDQLGICFRLCFEDTHEHGNRIDMDPEFRVQAISRIKQKLEGDQTFGTEWSVDRIAPYMDYIHGCGFAYAYSSDAYPALFRYTFPAIQMSSRGLHDEREDWKVQLNYNFVYGMIFDISIYRGRVDSIENVPEYAAYVKKLIDMRKEYVPFFTEGKVDLPATKLPDEVHGLEYSYGGETIVALWNNTDKEYVLDYGKDAGKTVEPDEVEIYRV